MTAVNIPKDYLPRIQAYQECRNGFPVTAGTLARLNTLANKIAAYRLKELFHYTVPIATIPVANLTRTRARFSAHTSPFMSEIVCVVYYASQDHTTGLAGCAVTITDQATSTTYGSGSASYGNQIINADVPNNFDFTAFTITGVPANTDIYGFIQDTGLGRLISCTIYEMPLAPDTTNGYLNQQYGLGNPILDTDRAGVAALATQLWQKQASSLFNFAVDLETAPITTTSASHLNILDGTSTAPSAATPGYTLDLRYGATVNGAGVPVQMAVYCTGTVGGGAYNIELVNSSGTQMGVVSALTGTGKWQVVTFTLPATQAKYDIRHFTSSGTGSLYAVSLLQLV